MLSANFGGGSTDPNSPINCSDLWWVEVAAKSYAHIQLADFCGSGDWNGSYPIVSSATPQPATTTMGWYAESLGDPKHRQASPVFPRVIQHASLNCPNSLCLLGVGHGCISTKVAGIENCKWPSQSAAQAGCGSWAECGGVVCDTSGSCLARSWDSPLRTGKSFTTTVYLKTPPPGPPPAPPTPAPPPPIPPLGPSAPFVEIAKRMKQINPKIKLQVYQASDRGSLKPLGHRQIEAHPEWWIYMDNGEPEMWGGRDGYHSLNWTVPEVKHWFLQYLLDMYGDHAEALFDGIFVDAGAFYPAGSPGFTNVSLARYRPVIDAMLDGLAWLQVQLTKLNGGMIIDNGGMEGIISGPGNPPDSWGAGKDYRDIVGRIGGAAFLEWFGSCWCLDDDGVWNSTRMNSAFHSIINASTDGYPIILKAAPGPASCLEFPSIGAGLNSFMAAGWKPGSHIDDSGGVHHNLSTTGDGVRADSAAFVEQIIAPFLIVAAENVFFSYAFFYDMPSGYIPCPKGVECGMPTEWFPQFRRPIGPPKGPAVQKGNVWTRSFEHVDVYVDTTLQSNYKLTWH